MTLRLNLMPWREQQRARAVRRFQGMMVAGLVMALTVVMVLDQAARHRLARQAEVVAHQQGELARLDTSLAQIDRLRDAQAAVQLQQAALAALRARQAQLPGLFHSLEQAMPDGAQLTEVNLQDERLRLAGLAASAAVVARFMRDLQQAGVVQGIELVHLRHHPRGNEFLLAGRVSVGDS